MGGKGLNKLYDQAKEEVALKKFAYDGFSINTNGYRGFRLGIDASLWMRHAQKCISGANPALRTIFFRFALVLSMGFIPIVVFDGRHRPSQKRGKTIYYNSEFPETAGMTAIAKAFGLECREAPGEAEAELAQMSMNNEVDAVLTDDSDALVFGARKVIKNWSVFLTGNSKYSNGKETLSPDDVIKLEDDDDDEVDNEDISDNDGNNGGPGTANGNDIEKLKKTAKFVTVYNAEKIETELKFDRDALILFVLLTGGDYSMEGLPNCGEKIAEQLCTKTNLAKELAQIRNEHTTSDLKIQETESLKEKTSAWIKNLQEILRTNPDNILSTRKPSLAKSLDENSTNFPQWKIIENYAYPATSSHPKYKTKKISEAASPDINQLISIMQNDFEWTHDQVYKKCRTILLQVLIMDEFRRKALQLDYRGTHDSKSQSLAIKNTENEDLIKPSLSAYPTLKPQQIIVSSSQDKDKAAPPPPPSSSPLPSLHTFFKSTKPSASQKQLEKTNASKSTAVSTTETRTITMSSSSSTSSSNNQYWNMFDIHLQRQHLSTQNSLEYRVEISPRKLILKVKPLLLPNNPNVEKVKQRKNMEMREKAVKSFEKSFPDKFNSLIKFGRPKVSINPLLDASQSKTYISSKTQTSVLVDVDTPLEHDEDWKRMLSKHIQESKPKRQVRYEEPASAFRLWLPAAQLELLCPDLVHDFRNRVKEKELAKNNNNKGNKTKSKSTARSKTLESASSLSLPSSSSQTMSTPKHKRKTKDNMIQGQLTSSLFSTPTKPVKSPSSNPKQKQKPISKPASTMGQSSPSKSYPKPYSSTSNKANNILANEKKGEDDDEDDDDDDVIILDNDESFCSSTTSFQSIKPPKKTVRSLDNPFAAEESFLDIPSSPPMYSNDYNIDSENENDSDSDNEHGSKHVDNSQEELPNLSSLIPPKRLTTPPNLTVTATSSPTVTNPEDVSSDSILILE